MSAFAADPPHASDLAALMCRRLCHDLAGPVGAALNGAELAAAEEGDPNEVLALIRQGARSAAVRIRFARLAFGAAGMRVGAPLGKLREAMEELLADAGVKLVWKVSGAAAPTFDGRILLSALLALLACLPNGGETSVEINPDNPDVVVVAVHGPQARMPVAMQRLLSGEEASPPQDSRQAPAFFAALLAAESGARIDVLTDRNRAEAHIVAPSRRDDPR